VLVLSGGEPLLREDVYDIARHAAERGLTAALATNGTLVDGECARRLAQSGVARVAISVDGADARTHDGLRGMPGALDAALAGLRKLRAHGLSVQINCTLTNRNLDQCEALHQLALREGAAALHFFVLVPVGCGLEIAESHRLRAEQVEDFLVWLARKAPDSPLQLKATCAPQYFRVRRQLAAQLARTDPASAPKGVLEAETRGCLAGTGVCFVSHRGLVFPCGYLPLEAGNVRRMPLKQIWETSQVLAAFRDGGKLEGKCAVCGFRGVCGGCRARAYGTTGNAWAEDPYCAYRPGERTEGEKGKGAMGKTASGKVKKGKEKRVEK
jgi:radical SAM protein with 4Fe4S-binding SPASM domain